MGSASSTIVLKNQLNHEALLSFDYFWNGHWLIY